MNTMPYLSALIGLLILSFQLHAGSIIKCRAADGSITFADTRCPAGQTQLSKTTHKQRRIQQQTTEKNLEKGAEFPADESTPKLPRLVFQSQFSQVLASLNSIKFAVIEYYTYRGRWPGTLEDLGFNPDEMTSSLIDATDIDQDGRIRAELNDEFGDDKEVWLYPKLVMGGTQIEWSCYTNFPGELLQGMTGTALCQSRYF